MNYKTYVKISRDELKENNIDNMNLLLFSHLQFLENSYQEIDTSINMICKKLNYKYQTTNTTNSYPIKIKNFLQTLQDQNKLTCYYDDKKSSINQIPNSKNFILNLNVIDYENKYVILHIDELIKILKISNKGKIETHKLLNVYLLIKSFMCMDPGSLHYCFLSDQSFIKFLKCGTDTFKKIKSSLIENQMFYYYQFNESENICSISGPINHIYTLENYDIEILKKEFK